jgi:outer membrane protein assembly factor BamE (lipoprotein component of BamABCDE complex)
MKTKITTFICIALGLTCVSLICGCVNTTQGSDFNSENVSKLKVGETTEQEVIQLIGQPIHVTRNSDGTAYLTYMYSPGATYTVFTPMSPTTRQQMKSLTVILDANGKVKSWTEN